jgi:hypothetical protein
VVGVLGVIVLFVQNLAVCFDIPLKINRLRKTYFRRNASFSCGIWRFVDAQSRPIVRQQLLLRLELCCQLRQVDAERVALLARGREFIALRSRGRLQLSAKCFSVCQLDCGAGAVGERPVQRGLGLLALRLPFAHLLVRGAGFREQPRAVLIELGDFVLLDDERLVGLAQFRLKPCDARGRAGSVALSHSAIVGVPGRTMFRLRRPRTPL